MGKIILVTGGSRSGKSSYALSIGESMHGLRTFIATCPVVDGEMEKRIAAHRLERGSDRWETIEEQTELADAVKKAAASDVILVDCITLWINNLMYMSELRNEKLSELKNEKLSELKNEKLSELRNEKLSELKNEKLSEPEIAELSRQLIDVCRSLPGTVIFVTNEVGMGIVPGDSCTRLYRDLVGRANQTIAAAADSVVMVVSGIAVKIKGDTK